MQNLECSVEILKLEREEPDENSGAVELTSSAELGMFRRSRRLGSARCAIQAISISAAVVERAPDPFLTKAELIVTQSGSKT